MTGMLDISTRIHSLLRAPLHTRIFEICQLVEQIPFKDLQTIFPQIVGSIFGNGGMSEDWGLRTVTPQNNAYDFENLYNFLIPTGPLFKICYKLIGDPQLKYVFPTRLLPLDVFQMLESGRVPQFYLDILNIDPHTRQIISLNLNPFDYYIFYFAVYLHNAPNNKGTWDSWNTVYYSLCCEYLLHFLPVDPGTPVLPHIAYFTGKTPAVSPMQTANRHSHFPSLLVSQEVGGSPGSVTASSSASQVHPRGEVWRSETVLQVFIDIWLNVSTQQDQQQVSQSPVQPARSTYPASEHVRIARSLIKQCHAFSLSRSFDPTNLGELRCATPALLFPRAIQHIRHLMDSWPLDASFRLVLELWFSYIQPWRYANLKDEKNQPEQLESSAEEPYRCNNIDRSFLPFINDNLLAYTEIFQLVVPRFLRLDLTAPKNAIMLFRLTKVFSQTNLVELLAEVEKSFTLELEPNPLNVSSFVNKFPSTPQNSYSLFSNKQNVFDRTINTLDNRYQLYFPDYQTDTRMEYCYNPQSFLTSNNQSLSQGYKTGSGVMTGIVDMGSGQYRPLFFGPGRMMVRDLILHAHQAHTQVLEIINQKEEYTIAQRRGFFGTISYWLMGDSEMSDDVSLEEWKKVPGYINFAINQLAEKFSLEVPTGAGVQLSSPGLSASSSNLTRRNVSRFNITMSPQEAKERAKHIKYMGNPDLQPVKSDENGFLVHFINQIVSRINEMYCEEMKVLWARQDFVGIISKEVLKPPCEIRSFCKSGPNYGSLVRQNLPPRLCFRSLASHAYMFWFCLLCFISYIKGYNIPIFILFCIFIWIMRVFFRASLKFLFGSERSSTNNDDYVRHAAHSFDNSDDSARFMYRDQSG